MKLCKIATPSRNGCRRGSFTLHHCITYMIESLRLYKDLLKAARAFPVRPVARKLESNIKEVSQAFLDEADADKVCGLHEDGRAAIRVIAFLRGLPKVSPSSVWVDHYNIFYPCLACCPKNAPI